MKTFSYYIYIYVYIFGECVPKRLHASKCPRYVDDIYITYYYYRHYDIDTCSLYIYTQDVYKRKNNRNFGERWKTSSVTELSQLARYTNDKLFGRLIFIISLLPFARKYITNTRARVSRTIQTSRFYRFYKNRLILLFIRRENLIVRMTIYEGS